MRHRHTVFLSLSFSIYLSRSQYLFLSICYLSFFLYHSLYFSYTDPCTLCLLCWSLSLIFSISPNPITASSSPSLPIPPIYAILLAVIFSIYSLPYTDFTPHLTPLYLTYTPTPLTCTYSSTYPQLSSPNRNSILNANSALPCIWLIL